MKNPNWTENELNILKNNLNKGLTIFDLEKMLPGRSYIAIKTKLNKDLKLKIKRTAIKDENFFEIPNTINSSIAGIISSDGHMHGIGHKSTGHISIKLSSKDIRLLEDINLATKSTQKILTYFVKNKIKTKFCEKIYEYEGYHSLLRFSNTIKWQKDIIKNWNIPIGKKSLLIKPPENLIDLDCCLAYISGLITGDGTIYLVKDNRSKTDTLRIVLLGTKELLDWCKNVIERVLNKEIKCEVRKQNKNANIYSFALNSIDAALLWNKIIKLNIVKLDRKWNNPEILSKINKYKQKYPQYFNLPTPDFAPYLPK